MRRIFLFLFTLLTLATQAQFTNPRYNGWGQRGNTLGAITYSIGSLDGYGWWEIANGIAAVHHDSLSVPGTTFYGAVKTKTIVIPATATNNGYIEMSRSGLGLSAGTANTLRLGSSTTGELVWVRQNAGSTDGYRRTFTSAPTGHRTYTFADADMTISGSASALTSGRVPFVTTGGLLLDDASFTYNTSTGLLLTTPVNATTYSASGTSTFTAIQNNGNLVNTGSITSPTVYGSSSASGTLNLMGSSSPTAGVVSVGSSTASSFIAQGSASVVGAVTTSNTVNMLTANSNTDGFNWRSLVGSSTIPALYSSIVTPTTTNYILQIAGSGATPIINGTSNVIFRINNSNVISLASGAITASGSFLGNSTIASSSPTAGIGYAAGSGSTITQASSRTTSVTCNSVTGAITLVSAAGSTSWQTFTVGNTAVAAKDVVIVSQKSGTDLNMIFVTAVAAGSFNISFATTGGTTTEQPVFNFAVIKGQTN